MRFSCSGGTPERRTMNQFCITERATSPASFEASSTRILRRLCESSAIHERHISSGILLHVSPSFSGVNTEIFPAIDATAPETVTPASVHRGPALGMDVLTMDEDTIAPASVVLSPSVFSAPAIQPTLMSVLPLDFSSPPVSAPASVSPAPPSLLPSVAGPPPPVQASVPDSIAVSAAP